MRRLTRRFPACGLPRKGVRAALAGGRSGAHGERAPDRPQHDPVNGAGAVPALGARRRAHRALRLGGRPLRVQRLVPLSPVRPDVDAPATRKPALVFVCAQQLRGRGGARCAAALGGVRFRRRPRGGVAYSYAMAPAPRPSQKGTSVANLSGPDPADRSADRLTPVQTRKPPGRSAMGGVRYERGGPAQSMVCLDGLAVPCGTNGTPRERSAPSTGTAAARSPAPGSKQGHGASRRPGALRAEPDRPAGRRRGVEADDERGARSGGGSNRMPAFLAAFEELRAALERRGR